MSDKDQAYRVSPSGNNLNTKSRSIQDADGNTVVTIWALPNPPNHPIFYNQEELRARTLRILNCLNEGAGDGAK